MTINVENCRKLAAAIAEREAVVELPAATPLPRFEMGEWAHIGFQPMAVRSRGEIAICHTAGCIAGSALALFDPKRYIRYLRGCDNVNIADVAGGMLGLNYYQANALFAPHGLIGLIKVHDAIAQLEWLADNPDVQHMDIRQHWRVLLRIGTEKEERPI